MPALSVKMENQRFPSVTEYVKNAHDQDFQSIALAN